MLAQDSYNTASTSVKVSCLHSSRTMPSCTPKAFLCSRRHDRPRAHHARCPGRPATFAKVLTLSDPLLFLPIIFDSAFFGRPINVKRIYANASPRLRPASPEHPITQSRQVHLLCANRVVCVATSIVTITSPESERLFLDDKFPIGQTFRQLRRNPQFSLLSVETPMVRGKRELRRTYMLETEGFKTEILEVFPDRDMFSRGEDWLLEESDVEETRVSVAENTKPDWNTIRMGPVVH